MLLLVDCQSLLGYDSIVFLLYFNFMSISISCYILSVDAVFLGFYCSVYSILIVFCCCILLFIISVVCFC
jgi:hypothetical protein